MSESMINDKSWKKRTILFLVSQCVTLFGSTLVQMAIIWYVTLRTSSGAWVAAFTVCSYLPQFLISFAGGVWADRHNRKLLIIGADAVIALVTLAMMLAMPYIGSEPALLSGLLMMSIVRSLGAGIQVPAVNAVLPRLVPEDKLMRYNGLNATMQSIVQFASPAATAALLTVSTLRSALLVDVLTAAVGIGIFAFVFVPRQEVSQEKVSFSQDMKLGVKYAFSDKLLGRLLIVYGLFIFLSVPGGFLAQLFVSRTYGNSYWYMSAVELVGFAGMAGGGLLMGVWGGFKSRISTLLLGLAAFGTFGAGMGLSRNFILYLSLMLAYGIALTMVQTATTTIIQEKADAAMQGRVFGLLGSMYSGFLPIGMAVFGPLADVVSLQWIMVGTSILLLMLTAVMKCSRSFTD